VMLSTGDGSAGSRPSTYAAQVASVVIGGHAHAATTLDRGGVRPSATQEAVASHREFHRQKP
jgi:hypothetical protein